MAIVYGVGIYMTIANIWFLLSALATDLLWLRFYLFAAYVFLFIAGLTNYPPWGSWERVNGGLWLLGGVLWPFFVGLIHLQGLARLIWDERWVRLPGKDAEELWCMMFRRSGMGRLEFKQALQMGRWQRYKPGEVIFDTQGENARSSTSLHLMAEGVAVLSAGRLDGTTASSSLYSGYLFNLEVCNAFGVYIGLERAPIEKVVAKTDCLLYKWDIEAVDKMASMDCMALAAAWRNFVLYAVGVAFSATCGDVYASSGEPEVPGYLDGARSRDMTEPLTEEEAPKFHFWTWFMWFIKSHNPIVPTGLRHNSMPSSGMLARGRLLARRKAGDDLKGAGSSRNNASYSDKMAAALE